MNDAEHDDVPRHLHRAVDCLRIAKPKGGHRCPVTAFSVPI